MLKYIILLTVMIISRPAKADFQPLLDSETASRYQEMCDDVDSIIQIIQLYDKSFTLAATSQGSNPVTGALVALAKQSETIDKTCSLVMRVGTAKNTRQALAAATGTVYIDLT